MPFLAGVLRPSWSRRTVALDGRAIVEVSLVTGDRPPAVSRWEELHPPVQAAVRDAEQRQAAARSAERDRAAPVAVRTVAAQVLHATLAEHDRTYTEPGHLNRTARAIGSAVAAADGIGREPDGVRDAERGFRGRLYRDALAERRLERLDLAITEGEVDLPREVAERLTRDPASLTAADRLALPPGHPDRGALALAVAHAQLRAAKLERARDGVPGDRHAADVPARPGRTGLSSSGAEPVTSPDSSNTTVSTTAARASASRLTGTARQRSLAQAASGPFAPSPDLQGSPPCGPSGEFSISCCRPDSIGECRSRHRPRRTSDRGKRPALGLADRPHPPFRKPRGGAISAGAFAIARGLATPHA